MMVKQLPISHSFQSCRERALQGTFGSLNSLHPHHATMCAMHTDVHAPLLNKLHHLGIAVRDLPATIALYRRMFAVQDWERISLPERHMQIAMCRVGDTMLEFITPTSEQAAFATFLRERGDGIHHVAYQVADIEAALRHLEADGMRLIDRHARPGIHNTQVAFLHPKATGGVLIELVEERIED